MPFCGFPSFMSQPAAPSEQLAREWSPYVETCIEAFGAERCMFRWGRSCSGAVACHDGKLTVDLRPFEILTLQLSLTPPCSTSKPSLT